MAFNSTQAFKVARRFQHKNGLDSRTLTAENYNVSYKDGSYQVVTTAGVSASSVKLPSPKDGSYYWVSNVASSAQNLNVNDHNGATKSTLTAGQGCLVVCDGSDWFIIIKA